MSPLALTPQESLALVSGLATVLVAVIGAASTAMVRRANRRLDAATARKTEFDAAASGVDMALKLANEIKAWSREQLDHEREAAERRIESLREVYEAKLADLSHDQADLREQLRALRAAFAAHETWDAGAVAALRTVQPDYPDPPPIDAGRR